MDNNACLETSGVVQMINRLKHWMSSHTANKYL
jgi:hypothetical protein